jgi:hypothetical protein
MITVFYIECVLCILSSVLHVLYAECVLLSVLLAECLLCRVFFKAERLLDILRVFYAG